MYLYRNVLMLFIFVVLSFGLDFEGPTADLPINSVSKDNQINLVVEQTIGEHAMVPMHVCRRFAIYLIFSFISFNSLYICLKPSNKTVTALV